MADDKVFANRPMISEREQMRLYILALQGKDDKLSKQAYWPPGQVRIPTALRPARS